MLAASLLLACRIGDQPSLGDDFGVCTEAPAPGEIPDGLLTYYERAKPIFDARCAGCHTEDGVAPFALESFADAYRFKSAIYAAVATGQMPPWQPDDCCNEYRWDRSLPADEQATLLAWIEQGAAAGDPSDEGPAIPVDRGGLSRVDVSTTMSEPFEPRAVIGADEVRCFLLDYEFPEDTFVTGLNVVPGNRSMVHHVIVFTIDGDDAPKLASREGHDGRPGWDCYGELAGDAKPTGSLGGWAPGSQGMELPDRIGRKVAAGSRIVLNMHYDTGAGTGADQTTVQLATAGSIDHELKGVAVANPLWLVEGGMPIAAGDDDAMVYFSYDPTVLTRGKSFLVYTINQHMHELGSQARIAVLRADGSTECLLNISKWDFDWLGDYVLEQPLRIDPGDELYVECHFDNTAENQRFVNGEQLVPRDLDWGTDEEMCAALLGVIEL